MKQPSERMGVKIVRGLKKVSTTWEEHLLVDLFRKSEIDQLANHVLPARK